MTGFEVHPSNQYLVAVSDQGFFYIFKLDTGELRGKVPVMSDPVGVAIDPSGLYLAISAKSNSVAPTGGLHKKWMFKTDKFNITTGSRTRILIYEIGTGNLASEISSLFEISSFSFSPDARFLVAGSTSGCVSIWAVGEKLQNIMSMPPDIWLNYPLYIRNEYTEQIEEANVEIFRSNIEDVPLVRERAELHNHAIPDRKFMRGEPAPFTRSKTVVVNNGSPFREKPQFVVENRPVIDHHHDGLLEHGPIIVEHRPTSRNHDMMLREHEKKFLRDVNSSPAHLPPRRHVTEHLRTVESPQLVGERIIAPRNEFSEERKLTPRKPSNILRDESPSRHPFSILKPESAYFRAEEPVIEDDARSNSDSQGSRKPELGSSFEARDSKAFKNDQERKRKETKTSKWKDYDSYSESTDQRRPIELPPQQMQMPMNYPMPYPTTSGMAQYGPAQMQYAPMSGYAQPGMPQALMYQAPNGNLIPYQHPMQMQPQMKERSDQTDTRSDMTPSARRDDDRSSFVDQISDLPDPREERKRSPERVIRLERPVIITRANEASTSPPRHQVNRGVYPVRKEDHQRTSSFERREYIHEDQRDQRRQVHEAYPQNSKLANLYKRREDEAKHEPAARIRSPPKHGNNAGILGVPRDQATREVKHVVLQNPPVGSVRPSEVQQVPHAAVSRVQPDPIDIDEESQIPH